MFSCWSHIYDDGCSTSSHPWGVHYVYSRQDMLMAFYSQILRVCYMDRVCEGPPSARVWEHNTDTLPVSRWGLGRSGLGCGFLKPAAWSQTFVWAGRYAAQGPPGSDFWVSPPCAKKSFIISSIVVIIIMIRLLIIAQRRVVLRSASDKCAGNLCSRARLRWLFAGH